MFWLVVNPINLKSIWTKPKANKCILLERNKPKYQIDQQVKKQQKRKNIALSWVNIITKNAEILDVTECNKDWELHSQLYNLFVCTFNIFNDRMVAVAETTTFAKVAASWALPCYFGELNKPSVNQVWIWWLISSKMWWQPAMIQPNATRNEQDFPLNLLINFGGTK